MAETRYAQVARNLSDRIADGTYPVGALLPTELALCEQYGVSRHTIRAAIAELQQLGLVSRRKKVGTRVEASEPVAQYRQSLASLGDLVQFSAKHVREVRGIEAVVLDQALARQLGCDPGSRWVRISSLRHDGKTPSLPIAWTDVYVSENEVRLHDIAALIQQSPDMLISSLLETHYGRRIAQVRQEVSGALIPEALASALQVPPHSPALRVVRRYLDEQGELLDLSLTYHPADRYTLVMQLEREQASNTMRAHPDTTR